MLLDGSSAASAISSSVGVAPELRRRARAPRARSCARAGRCAPGCGSCAPWFAMPRWIACADPEGRVGRELVALAPVELLGRADQAEDALLDQVEQGQVLALVLLRDRDDQAQVRVDHALLGLEVAALDRLRQLDLLVGAQQRVAPDLVEEQLERVAVIVASSPFVVPRRLDPPRAAVVGHLDAARLDPLGQSCASSSERSSSCVSSDTSERFRQPSSSPRLISASICEVSIVNRYPSAG